MSDYEIGRDIQELRSRIDRLEGGSDGGESAFAPKRAGQAGRAMAGVRTDVEPVHWKERIAAVPPFVHNMLGIKSGMHLDGASSKTWGCVPDPLILFVNWDAGGSDELYRYENQKFSIIRTFDPNNNTTTCTASYTATFIASGKGDSNSGLLYFIATLRDSSGGALTTLQLGGPIFIRCHDKFGIDYYSDFAPGLYDLVAGATWEISGFQTIDRCR